MEELIPKNTAPVKAASGSELAALNDLLALMNNSAITGAQVPPEEKENIKVKAAPRPASKKEIPATVAMPEPKEAPTPQTVAEAIAKVKLPGTDRPLIVLTGRSGTGKSWLQAQLRGTRNVVTSLADANDFRALRQAGAEFWHVMASDDTRARRRSPAASARQSNQLVVSLDMDANNKLAKLPVGEKLHVIWNDTAPQPFAGMYNTTAFLNAVS